MKAFLIFFICSSVQCAAQIIGEKDSLKITGYMEVYYLYDLINRESHTRPEFVYSYNRSNEINLNLGFMKGSYSSSGIRANLAIMTGTYVNANLKNEPGVLKNLFEANIGARISKKRDLWVDAGIFASHIGFESAIGKDSWNLTRSILADNSPYFESGVKVGYTTPTGMWFLSGMILNGWQRIQMIEGNSLPSFGTQITFRPSGSVTLNSSTFLGTDKPDSARLIRYFHNFYGIFRLSERIAVTIGLDNGWEERQNDSGYNLWYSPVVIFRTKLSEKISFDLRGEYYDDSNNVIVKSADPFRVKGISMNIDYQIFSNALWRLELRHLNGAMIDKNTCITTCLAVGF
jgi:hypothetical protein